MGMRCEWCGEDPLYLRYHDEEWGRFVADDRRLFEFMLLESAQAGLSWLTILRKREGYRKAFCDFDYRKVSKLSEEDEERLRGFDGIVRNRLKIHSAVINARLFQEIADEYGSFYDYLSSFFAEDSFPIVHDIPDMTAIPVTSPESEAISQDMRRRGFKFFGPTICYAFLQATGFVDDHLNCCPCKGMKR